MSRRRKPQKTSESLRVQLTKADIKEIMVGLNCYISEAGSGWDEWGNIMYLDTDYSKEFASLYRKMQWAYDKVGGRKRMR